MLLALLLTINRKAQNGQNITNAEDQKNSLNGLKSLVICFVRLLIKKAAGALQELNVKALYL